MDSKRTTEQIRCVLDRNGSTLDKIYQRALRKHGPFDARIELQLTIEPSGKVSSVKITSSTAKFKSVEQELIEAVYAFDFPTQEVSQWTGPIDVNFLAQ